MSPDEIVNVRYMVDDVSAALDFHTAHFAFVAGTVAAPAFADATRGNLRLLLSGPQSPPGGPCPMALCPSPGGGTASTSSPRTSTPRWRGWRLRVCRSATTCSPVPEAGRSW